MHMVPRAVSTYLNVEAQIVVCEAPDYYFGTHQIKPFI